MTEAYVVSPVNTLQYQGYRLVDVAVKLLDIEDPPSRVKNFRVAPKYTQTEGGVVFFLTHYLEGWNKNGRFLTFTCTYGFAFTNTGALLSRAELKKFVPHLLPFAHTLVGELVHNLTALVMPTHPLVLDIYKPKV